MSHTPSVAVGARTLHGLPLALRRGVTASQQGEPLIGVHLRSATRGWHPKLDHASGWHTQTPRLHPTPATATQTWAVTKRQNTTVAMQASGCDGTGSGAGGACKRLDALCPPTSCTVHVMSLPFLAGNLLHLTGLHQPALPLSHRTRFPGMPPPLPSQPRALRLLEAPQRRTRLTRTGLGAPIRKSTDTTQHPPTPPPPIHSD